MARLAVARLLRARVIDITTVVGKAGQSDLQVFAAPQLADASQRAALLDLLAAGPGGPQGERLLVVPRAAAEELFGAGLGATGTAGASHLLHGGERRDVGTPALPVVESGSAATASSSSGGETPHLVCSGGHDLAVSEAPVPSLPMARVAELLRTALEGCGEGDVNRPHPLHGGTCLHVAAGLTPGSASEAAASASLVAELCCAGADIAARAANDSTPLHWAAGVGNAAAVNELLRRGADPGLMSYTWRSNVFGKGSGQTPAHWAAESGHQECVELLLRGSALASFMEDERGRVPADLAATEGHDGVLAMLETVAESEMVCLAVTTEAVVHTPVPQGAGEIK